MSPVVQIALVEGRDPATRAALIAAVTSAVTDTLAVEPERVRVLLHEVAAENWGVAGRPKAAP